MCTLMHVGVHVIPILSAYADVCTMCTHAWVSGRAEHVLRGGTGGSGSEVAPGQPSLSLTMHPSLRGLSDTGQTHAGLWVPLVFCH